MFADCHYPQFTEQAQSACLFRHITKSHKQDPIADSLAGRLCAYLRPISRWHGLVLRNLELVKITSYGVLYAL